MTAPGSECHHEERASDGRCARCGICLHGVVLNGACYYCGETVLERDVRSGRDELVPADRLVGRRRNRK